MSERDANGGRRRMAPDFDELVGPGLSLEGRQRLLRVHELLVVAGPPPEIDYRAPVVELRPRRRRGVLLALAATFVAAAFALGALVGNRTAGPSTQFEVSMRGTANAPAATATLAVFALDDAGNWPLEMTVEGLPPAASGKAYQLWLTDGEDLVELCGAFRTQPDGSATVPMNAPYRFKDYDGWVVVEEGAQTPLLTT